jgi:spermidine dehydrogenase
MDRITRRDFLNGMALAVVAGVAPASLLAGTPSRTSVYPPGETGSRGSAPGSFDTAHALRDGMRFDASRVPVSEIYDLVVVGAGLSGLAAA